MLRISFVVLLFIITSCTTQVENDSESDKLSPLNLELHTFDIRNLNDEEYPDNPDIGFRASNYDNDLFESGQIQVTNAEKLLARLEFITKTKDTIQLLDFALGEYVPTIPNVVADDDYLSYISCINQEWNRNQVKFVPGEFKSEQDEIIRVDVARNCLNAYLWEVIVYVEEDGKEVPYAHGWYDFPHELYGQLFEQKNNLPYADYRKPLEDWIDPENKYVDLSMLRQVNNERSGSFEDRSDEMYPVKGAREKKFKEIIYPETFETMRDLQTDKALFATFTPPGYYNRKDPRTTELGRIYTLDKITTANTTNSGRSGHTEIRLDYTHRNGKQKTSLVLGGLTLDDFPVLSPEEANKGWKNSMGIGNHTFYETNDVHNSVHATDNQYYAMFLDREGNWLDSHTIGIDGPIFHFEDEERRILHLWLLSFERHALVGHYVIKFD